MIETEEKLETIEVIKRNGKKVPFDGAKVAMAIKKGFDSTIIDDEEERKYTSKDIQKVYDKIIQNNSNRHKKAIFGRVLHIDGDKEYLESCLGLYKEIGIYSEGIYMPEKEVYKQIEKIMLLITPDIVVITGHDAFVGTDKTISLYEQGIMAMLKKKASDTIQITDSNKLFISEEPADYEKSISEPPSIEN